MEEVLSNQQARPGDATQLMHVIFSSDDEMMSLSDSQSFYES